MVYWVGEKKVAPGEVCWILDPPRTYSACGMRGIPKIAHMCCCKNDDGNEERQCKILPLED